MAHAYDSQFMDYAAVSSAYAARRISGLLLQELSIASVLDVGCAHGTWLRTWSDAGVSDIKGLDGNYVDDERLEIAKASFSAADLNQPFSLGQKYDLVQSLEVAEHIRPEASQSFIDCVSGHATKFVLFSAAPPGQGGEFHINERPYEYWRRLFNDRGFAVFDWVRPLIVADQRISFWYRYNLFLYVRREHISTLPATIAATSVPEHVELPDLSPAGFKLRKAVISRLPYRLQHEMARLKARVLPTGRF